MMKWFGRDWGAPFCKEAPQVPVPVDALCHCGEPIGEGDDGFITDGISEDMHVVQFAQHYECHMRQIIGGVAHQLETCSCYVPGATEADPPELTRRQAARLAVELWDKKNSKGKAWIGLDDPTGT